MHIIMLKSELLRIEENDGHSADTYKYYRQNNLKQNYPIESNFSPDSQSKLVVTKVN